MKKILYIDMDGVLADWNTAIKALPQETRDRYAGKIDELHGLFGTLKPLPGAIEAFELLASAFDVYILSTPSWNNPSSWSDKLLWVQQYLGKNAEKRLILSHRKDLNLGAFLIDDRLKNGADKFTGEHIHFGTAKFPGWPSVINYLMART